MARIKGIDLPKNKRGVIGLTYIYGIGPSFAVAILDEANISHDIKVQDWTDEQTNAIRTIIGDSFNLLLKSYLLKVQDNFSNILYNTLNSRKFMINSCDFD